MIVGKQFGVTSMAGRLRRVAMRKPGALLSADADRWHYAKQIDASAALAQFETFVSLVAGSGAEIEWFDDDDADDLADSVFTYDPSFVVSGGAVVLRPGKVLRQPEAALHGSLYDRIGIPVLGTIDAPGTFEGGDAFFLDASTIAVGRGFRTNDAGIEQFRSLVAPLGIETEVYDLPYFSGPDACLHLLSMISPLGPDLALVHEPLLPVRLHQDLVERGYELVVAPPEEFEASSGLNLNVLAVAPREVIAVAGFEGTVRAMRDAGCTVATFVADELCIPCEGGPTCLTRPLHRDA